jgi:hypothetical protein
MRAVAKQLPKAVLDYFRQHGARGGTIAGKTMTAAQLKARATKASHAAAIARTAKKNAKKTKP